MLGPYEATNWWCSMSDPSSLTVVRVIDWMTVPRLRSMRVRRYEKPSLNARFVARQVAFEKPLRLSCFVFPSVPSLFARNCAVLGRFLLNIIKTARPTAPLHARGRYCSTWIRRLICWARLGLLPSRAPRYLPIIAILVQPQSSSVWRNCAAAPSQKDHISFCVALQKRKRKWS
jgi:hypothetical protein